MELWLQREEVLSYRRNLKRKMPQESNCNSSFFTSPSKRGLKALVSNSNEASCIVTEEIINDHELAQRKAEEAASRRYKAAEWLREMDHGASASLPKEPSEEEFCLALRNGLILCNVLNKVNPGAVLKVVDYPTLAVQSAEGAAQSAIQYFENMRNFLEAVKDMKLLTFEASDLEKGGSSSKVVDCILCLKGYYEWKLAGGVGVWRYGGTVRITSFPKGPSSIIGSESTDESLDESESSQYEQLLEFLHLSNEVSIQETRTVNALAFLFDHFGLRLLQAYLRETDGIEDLPMNAMVIDTLLSKVVKDFSALLVSQGTQLGLFLKKILKGDIGCLSKTEFIEAISLYLGQRSSLASKDFSKFCICGGKFDSTRNNNNNSLDHAEIINTQQKQLEGMKYFFEETKMEVKQIHSEWGRELSRLEHHIKSLEVASSSYHKVLEENRQLYNLVQDLKGAIRVYCRVRPFLPGQSNGQSTVDYIGENGSIMIVNPLKQGKDARRVFSFNKVFATNVTQEQIYADTQPLIRSVLDGYNVCIFAYGQTGSGKTYTMSGPDLTTEETWGVNYRALRDLFHISKERVNAIKYEVGVQMIEIYNEQVRDLLLNGLNVPDACLVPVNCTQDVLDLMRIGQKNRAVGATALNERSSRSHSILTVHVRGRELVSNSILKGCLHLVDLAGSERVDKSEAVGERLKEAQHINRSLSALGDVIYALAQKSPHIPYRNSKLTQVLQDSLGGHAKTLMFVHINPEQNALGETISTLKFAERVASIELGAAQSNKETGEIRELKDEISNLKLALERKETELEQLRAGNARNTAESQKQRALSPFRLPKNGVNSSLKPEIFQRPSDDRISEARSCSSGKQRRSRFPSSFMDKESIPRMPLLAEEKIASSGKGRSPSPPIRRSLSTDRGSVIKSKAKIDTSDNQPIVKHPFPARVPVNKSLSPMPIAPCIDNNSRMYANSHEPVKQDNISESLFNLQKVNFRKVHQEQEEEQFKHSLNAVRQGGIRKIKPEGKVKAKHHHHHQQLPFRIQKSDLMPTLFPEMDFSGEKTMDAPRKSDYSEPENDDGLIESPVHSALNLKKIRQNFPRNSQNLEPRGTLQAGEPLLASRVENKLLNGSGRNLKEGSNTSMPEFRRSRSTPRGKFLLS
ncbi:kinesin-like protein KIN-14F [Senna tora]|uniref:Kinesin-like protein KIN-14F n=1 Tax=Senna tora TaxID=362788 RepID=A0A834TYV4_9FABA|nr:kinesin-like protein KIN-14F [Senna tora]